MAQDIRWQQRFASFKKALNKFNIAIDVIQEETGDNTEEEIEMLKEGLVKRFEYTYELAWNVMKDYAEYQGQFEIKGSRDATRHGFKMGLIEDAGGWMNMLESRKLTTHTYDRETADEVHNNIINNYHSLFLAFEMKMEEIIKSGTN